MADSPGFRFNVRAYSYVDAQTGRFLSREAVRNTLDNALTNNAKVMRDLSQQLRDGRISLADWQRGVAQEVKNVHLYSAAAAKGGWAQMTPADYARVGARIETQFRDFLMPFAQEIADGLPLNDRFLWRTALYSEAGRATFHTVERQEMEVRGMTEERSIRHANDSCDGCLEAEDQGWQPIGEIVLIGERDCMVRCKCTMDYR